MRNGLIIASGGLAGAIAVAWASFAHPPVAVLSAPSVERPEDSAQYPSGAASTAALVVSPPAPMGESDAVTTSTDPEVDALRLRNEELTNRLLVERAEYLYETEGAPVSPPRYLPVRYEADVLVDRLSEALAEAGFKDARVTSVDCDEYPCIALGEGISGREQLMKLKGTRALGEYMSDSRQAFGMKIGDPPRTVFGLALIPTDDNRRAEEINRRLRYRMTRHQQLIRN